MYPRSTRNRLYALLRIVPEIYHPIGHAVKDYLIAEIITDRDVLVHIEPFLDG